MYLCHALKQSTIPAQVCKNLPPKAGKSETSSTNAWIRDVPDTPGRQAPKFCKNETPKPSQHSFSHIHLTIKHFTKVLRIPLLMLIDINY